MKLNNKSTYFYWKVQVLCVRPIVKLIRIGGNGKKREYSIQKLQHISICHTQTAFFRPEFKINCLPNQLDTRKKQSHQLGCSTVRCKRAQRWGRQNVVKSNTTLTHEHKRRRNTERHEEPLPRCIFC